MKGAVGEIPDGHGAAKLHPNEVSESPQRRGDAEKKKQSQNRRAQRGQRALRVRLTPLGNHRSLRRFSSLDV